MRWFGDCRRLMLKSLSPGCPGRLGCLDRPYAATATRSRSHRREASSAGFEHVFRDFTRPSHRRDKLFAPATKEGFMSTTTSTAVATAVPLATAS